MARRVITVTTPHEGTLWADNPLSKSLLGILTNTVWDSLIYDRPVINALLKPEYLLTFIQQKYTASHVIQWTKTDQAFMLKIS